jgi:hypothetical protein
VQEELQQMQIPVRVWATIKAMAAADNEAAAAAAAADSLDARASSELVASTSFLQQQGSTAGNPNASIAAAGQELHPDIMQRRMPRNFLGTGSTGTTYVKVTQTGLKEAYALKVQPLWLGQLGLQGANHCQLAGSCALACTLTAAQMHCTGAYRQCQTVPDVASLGTGSLRLVVPTCTQKTLKLLLLLKLLSYFPFTHW